jgi:hypothetical protein
MHTLPSIKKAQAAVIRAQSVSIRLRVRLKQLKEAAAQSRITMERLRSEAEERVLQAERKKSLTSRRGEQAAGVPRSNDN